VEDPRKALAELIRVAGSGPQVIVSDADWDIQAVDATDGVLTKAETP